MGKEKIIGALIFIFALLVLIYYTYGLILIPYIPGVYAWADATFPAGDILRALMVPDQMFLLTLPIWLAAVLIMVIAMWIGWTMLTTPAPEPLEDFDFDEEKIEPEAKTE
jgi:hypothetical protein